MVAFCGGSGITPVMSITKSVLATTGRTVRLLYANRDRESVIFGDDLSALRAGDDGRLEVALHFDSDRGFLAPRTSPHSSRPTPRPTSTSAVRLSWTWWTPYSGRVGPEHIFVERF